ncbi:hypothetical protein C1H46_040844 [Malus baccata]|uniref:Uncharacterized protein n=1 Tax=Malus baccata TaxID=106549 RepID=A0A540KHF3_MALBA|nr:hypothetical protein C1H46_040844 [Malus baccata]
MGTREVYEQKLRSGNLHHDPTMNPGLGTPRCPRCLSLLAHDSDKGEWTITPVLHDATAVAGSGIGGMLSTIHSFNTEPLLERFQFPLLPTAANYNLPSTNQPCLSTHFNLLLWIQTTAREPSSRPGTFLKE